MPVFNLLSYNKCLAITKSDTVDFSPYTVNGTLTNAVYVGGAGIVEAVFQDGSTADFTAVAGEILPIAIRRVNSTTTTATLMVACYAF